MTKELFLELLEVKNSNACNMFDRNCINQNIYNNEEISKEQHRDFIANFEKYYKEFVG